MAKLYFVIHKKTHDIALQNVIRLYVVHKVIYNIMSFTISLMSFISSFIFLKDSLATFTTGLNFLRLQKQGASRLYTVSFTITSFMNLYQMNIQATMSFAITIMNNQISFQAIPIIQANVGTSPLLKMHLRDVLVLLICVPILVYLDCFSHSITIEV